MEGPKTKQDDKKKKKRTPVSGRQVFSSVPDYLKHVEDTMGKLHIDATKPKAR